MTIKDLPLSELVGLSKFEENPYQRNLTERQIIATEANLGYKLPAAYIELLKYLNGGYFKKVFPLCDNPILEDVVEPWCIFSIDSLTGDSSPDFWHEEWGYPNIGVPFADSPTCGHELFYLDYRDCGPDGEPKVAYVEQELDYKITVLAENFEVFLRALITKPLLTNSLDTQEKVSENNRKRLWPYQFPTFDVDNE